MVDEPREGDQVLDGQVAQGPPVHRQFLMGVRRDAPMTWKVLAYRGHARRMHTRRPGDGQIAHRVDPVGEGPISDDPAHATVQVEHRGEAEVHPHGAQLRGHEPTDALRRLAGALGLVAMQGPEAPRRRQAGEAGAETLHPPALLVHPNQQAWLPQTVNRPGEGRQLGRTLIVSGKQNDPADSRMAQQLAILRGQLGPVDIQHHGT